MISKPWAKNQKKDIGPLEKGKEHKQEKNLNKKKSKTSWNTSVIMMYSKIKISKYDSQRIIWF